MTSGGRNMIIQVSLLTLVPSMTTMFEPCGAVGLAITLNTGWLLSFVTIDIYEVYVACC